MYAYIKGLISYIEPGHIVVDNNGIGFLIIVANPNIFNLNDNVLIYTHHHVKEDVNSLYGFNDLVSKELFLKLISVSGIGPKTAMTILASNDTLGIINAIENNDLKYLTKFPGIGPKTGQQIILDLKGKFNKHVTSTNKNIVEATNALLALGYTKSAINKVMVNLNQDHPIEQLIKDALAKL